MYIVVLPPEATSAGVQPMAAKRPAGRNGLSQLIDEESKKMPPGAICAIER